MYNIKYILKSILETNHLILMLSIAVGHGCQTQMLTWDKQTRFSFRLGKKSIVTEM